MPRSKRSDSGRPFSLHTVQGVVENKHANTTFLRCSGRSNPFAVECAGYVHPGEDIIAEWGSDGKLVSLSQAMVKDSVVKTVKHLKGAHAAPEVPLTQVEDLR